jgi:hypothetical protein
MGMPRIEGGWWVGKGPLGPTLHLAQLFINDSVLMHCGRDFPVEAIRPELPADNIICALCATAYTREAPQQ